MEIRAPVFGSSPLAEQNKGIPLCVQQPIRLSMKAYGVTSQTLNGCEQYVTNSLILGV